MLEMTVSGMTCGHCVRAVSEAVSHLPGVVGVAVDLEASLVRVQGVPDPKAVRSAIEEEGYHVRAGFSLELNGAAAACSYR